MRDIWILGKRGFTDAWSLAQDATHWITVKSNGSDHKGRNVPLDDNGVIQGGMGGKFTGQHIGAIPHKTTNKNYNPNAPTKYKSYSAWQALQIPVPTSAPVSTPAPVSLYDVPSFKVNPGGDDHDALARIGGYLKQNMPKTISDWKQVLAAARKIKFSNYYLKFNLVDDILIGYKKFSHEHLTRLKNNAPASPIIPGHKAVTGKFLNPESIPNWPDAVHAGVVNNAMQVAIKAQGFDGLPQVVSEDEFKKAVEASGIMGYRTYTGNDDAELNGYQHDLYEGDFYTDCSGGSLYGHGMYVATGELLDDEYLKSAKTASKAYGDSAKSNFTESITMQSDSKIAVCSNGMEAGYMIELEYGLTKIKELMPENSAVIDKIISDVWDCAKPGKNFNDLPSAITKSFKFKCADKKKINQFINLLQQSGINLNTKDKSKVRKVLSYYTDPYTNVICDSGLLGVLLGYDAIKNSNGYLTVLNRSKCIIKEGAEKWP